MQTLGRAGGELFGGRDVEGAGPGSVRGLEEDGAGWKRHLATGTLASPGKTTTRIFNKIILKRFNIINIII
jgi:hypothetical protein